MADPDLEIVLRVRAGDRDAYGELVVKYQSILAAMLHRFATCHSDLEDLVQDTFVKAWKALPDWQPQQPFSHWLKRIAARTGLEYCRRRKRSPVTAMEHPPETAAHDTAETSGDALDTARQLLSTLPADERALLTLVHLNGLSMAEAADHFGWSRAKTKIKAFRARGLLRKTLKRHGYRES